MQTRTDIRNTICICVGESLWGFQASLIASATVLTVLLTRFGASERLIGSIAAIEAGTIAVPQLLGIYLFRSTRRRKRQLIAWHLYAIIPFHFVTGLLILFSNGFPAWLTRCLLLVSYGCMLTGIGLVLGVWLDWLAEIFDTRIRGTAIGLSMGASALAGTAGALLAGRLISQHDNLGTYAILYLAAGLVAIISISVFMAVDDPATRREDRVTSPALRSLVRHFWESLSDRNFRNFLIGRIITTAGFCILPFVAIRYMSAEGGSLTGGAVVMCGAAQTASLAVAHVLLGRIGDRHGHKIGMVVGVLGQVVALCVMLLSAGPLSCACAYAATGVGIAASFTSHTNMLFETCPHDNRLVHITIGSLVLSPALIVLPLLAGLLVSLAGLRAILAGSLALSLLALLWMSLMVREPRQQDA